MTVSLLARMTKKAMIIRMLNPMMTTARKPAKPSLPKRVCGIGLQKLQMHDAFCKKHRDAYLQQA